MKKIADTGLLKAALDRDDDSRELAELLLCTVRGPHRPVKREDFDRLRQRARLNLRP